MSDPYSDELHEILLRVAGRLPDDALSTGRRLLAEGRVGEVARILVFAARRMVLPLTAGNLEVLSQVLQREGTGVSSLEHVELAAGNSPLLWRFSPERESSAESEQDEDAQHAMLISALAGQDLLAAAAEEPGLRGLWSAVRKPFDNTPHPPPKVIYVVELDDELEGAGTPAEVAGRFQAILAAAGEQDPQIEVVSLSGYKPAYQYAVQTRGKVLWAADPDVEIKVARVFDRVDPEEGPSFAPEHPKIDDEEERDRILDYLESGTRLLMTAARLKDVVEPERGTAVPTNFYTDGSWVWTDTVGYYLEQYHLAPDAGLLAHIDAVGGPPPHADTIALGRAMEALTPSGDRQPVWTGS